MAPKSLDKQQQPQQSIVPKHSNPFYISAQTLCHNRRLKRRRAKWAEELHNLNCSKNCSINMVRRKQLNSLQADVTIDLVSDDSENNVHYCHQSNQNNIFIETNDKDLLNNSNVHQMTVMSDQIPIEIETSSVTSMMTNRNTNSISNNMLSTSFIKTMPNNARKRKGRRPKKTQISISDQFESIVLSDDSNLEKNHLSNVKTLDRTIHNDTPQNNILPSNNMRQNNEVTVSLIPRTNLPNSIQVDEVTVSLVPRSPKNSYPYTYRKPTNSNKRSSAELHSKRFVDDPFPMMPDETTVQTVIANRIYELPLNKVREGLASCGIPEFATNPTKVLTQRRKAIINPPFVTPPQAPISLKLSSDLSISLISDDDDDDDGYNIQPMRRRNDTAILSPALLQKLPLNVSIAPVVPIIASVSNAVLTSRLRASNSSLHTAMPKRKLG